MRFPFKVPAWAGLALFVLSVICFVVFGPWRAMHGAYSYDFASLYGAARNWIDGVNPYDMRLVTEQVNRAGYNPSNFPDYSPIQPSVYLPTTLPLVSLIAWLPWESARLLWACLSAAAFALSLSLLLLDMGLSQTGKWLVWAGAFCFSPAFLGLSHGNPSVLACSLSMMAVCLALQGRAGYAGLALGIASCMKPQISLAVILLFALWRYWRPLWLSLIYPAVATVVSVLRAPSLGTFEHWLITLRHAIAAASSPGSINDPSPANVWGAFSMVNTQTLLAIWMHSPFLVDLSTLLIAAALTLLYLGFRRDLPGDNRLRDMAFFSAVTLTIVYHRFYDEQLLLLVIPFLLTLPLKARTVLLWLFMLALLFPLHVFSFRLSTVLSADTPIGLLLLRPLPLIVLGMCLLLIPWEAKTVSLKDWWPESLEPGRN